MKITLKETFSKQALALERQLWQANPTDQKTLLALHSGSVSGVHVPGGSPQEKAAKEKEEKETTYDLMLQVMEAAYERFSQTLEEVKYHIAETRQYFQKKLDDLDQDEAAFKKDTILLQQGLEVYPDADDPRRYFYQDESGGWHELKDEAFLEEAKDIHKEMGLVRTMQNKKAWDGYEDGVKEGLKITDHAEARVDEIKRKVDEDVISPDEGQKQVEEIGEKINELRNNSDRLLKEANEGGAEFIGNEKEASKHNFGATEEQGEASLNSDNDLLEDFEEIGPGVTSFPAPFK